MSIHYGRTRLQETAVGRLHETARPRTTKLIVMVTGFPGHRAMDTAFLTLSKFVQDEIEEFFESLVNEFEQSGEYQGVDSTERTADGEAEESIDVFYARGELFFFI